MGFYGFLTVYPQLISKIQSDNLSLRDELALVQDFVRNNRKFARYCLLHIRHAVIMPFRYKYLRMLIMTLAWLLAAITMGIITLIKVLATGPIAVWPPVLIASALAVVVFLGLSLTSAFICQKHLVTNMHNLIKHHYKIIDRHKAYQESRPFGLEKYAHRIVKAIYCDSWPERAVILRSGGRFEVIFEELFYSDDNDIRYLTHGTLNYQWIEDADTHKSVDTIEQAERQISIKFANNSNKNTDMFNWLD